MPTKVLAICPTCKSKSNPNKRIFDILADQARGKKPRCAKHGAVCNLVFEFPFGLGARDSVSTLLDCFLPSKPESWRDKASDNKIMFHPFMVIFKRQGRKQAIWLPYWHVVKRKRKKKVVKYGQWAPYMDMCLFEDLLQQASSRGYFKGRPTIRNSNIGRP